MLRKFISVFSAKVTRPVDRYRLSEISHFLPKTSIRSADFRQNPLLKNRAISIYLLLSHLPSSEIESSLIKMT